MPTEKMIQKTEPASAGSAAGHTLALARKRMRLSGEALATQTGLSRRTIGKIEQGDESVAFGSYRKVAQYLNVQWLFDLFAEQEYSESTKQPKYYLTGSTALALPGPGGRSPALWYTSSVVDPATWRIAGRHLASTIDLIGIIGLWDATDVLSRYGVSVPKAWCASPERATFDLLIHYCEHKGRPVPNIQASDIDDVVDLGNVVLWIDQCSDFLSLAGKTRINAWLEGANYGLGKTSGDTPPVNAEHLRIHRQPG